MNISLASQCYPKKLVSVHLSKHDAILRTSYKDFTPKLAFVPLTAKMSTFHFSVISGIACLISIPSASKFLNILFKLNIHSRS